MERFIPILFIFFLSVSNLIAQDNKVQIYGNVGKSFFGGTDSDSFSSSLDDLPFPDGFHIGLGLQINNLIGIEIAVDEAPTINREDLLTKELEANESITGNYTSRYTSLMGTLTKRLEHDFPIINDSSIVVKGGVASYSTSRVYDSRTIADSSDMVFSIGALYHLTEKQDFEFSVTKVFGDASSLSFNIYWKYKFFKF